MAYTVYCHTNNINNKKYVGVTSQKPLARWQNGKHYSRHKAFYDDILKYGWDNFTHEILDTDLTEEEAKEKEKYYIEIWETQDVNKGYNRHKGGNVPQANNQAVNKLKMLNTGKDNPFYNHKHTAEAKELMKKNRPKKSVVCIDTGVTYASTREAERQTGAYHGDISKCCNGKLSKAGGYRWKYA